MLNNFRKKRKDSKDIRKIAKMAFKQEVENTVKAVHAHNLLEDSAKILAENNYIDPELYTKNNVKRGLRNANGTGVVVGLTKIGEVVGYKKDESGNKVPVEGKLLQRLQHRGYSQQLPQRGSLRI